MTRFSMLEQRAIAHWMQDHPGYVPQLSVAGDIPFKHKKTGDIITRTITGLVSDLKKFREEKQRKGKKTAA